MPENNTALAAENMKRSLDGELRFTPSCQFGRGCDFDIR